MDSASGSLPNRRQSSLESSCGLYGKTGANHGVTPAHPNSDQRLETILDVQWTRLRPPSRVLLLAFVGLLSLGILCTGSVAATDGPLEGVDGTGTEADPYVITDVEELQAIDNEPDAHYVLGNNIDANETREWNSYAGFEPIAAGGTFDGSLDGQNYEIRGLVVDGPATDRVGLFATVNGTVANVNLIDVTVVGSYEQDVGGLAGATTEHAVIERSSVSGSVTGDQHIGGLVGRSAGTVLESSASADVQSSGEYRTSRIGGLVGFLEAGSVTRSVATGDVTGIRSVGGLVGASSSGTAISDSYATGDVTGVDHDDTGSYFGWEDSRTVGGLVGLNSGSVATSFSTGAVTGTEQYHGLFGVHNRVIDVYWDVDASGHERGSEESDSGMTGLTTDEMTGPEAAENMPALDFDTVFETTEDGYPILRAEFEPAEFRVVDLEGPEELEADESGEIIATIENVGAVEGTETVVLARDETTEATRSVTLESGENETVTFEFTPATDGEYEYAVEADNEAAPDDASSLPVTVTATEGSSSDDDTDDSSDGLPGFTIGVAVVAVSLALISARRYTSSNQ